MHGTSTIPTPPRLFPTACRWSRLIFTPTRVMFGPGTLALGELARELGATRLVGDGSRPRIGWHPRAPAVLERRGLEVLSSTTSRRTRRPSTSISASSSCGRSTSIHRLRRRRRAMDCARGQLHPDQRRRHVRLQGLRQSQKSRCCRRSACLPPPAPAAKRIVCAHRG